MIRLTELTLSVQVDAVQFAREARRLCEGEGRVIGVETEALEGLFRQTEERMLDFARMFDARPLAEAVNACFAARRTGQAVSALKTRLRTARPVPEDRVLSRQSSVGVWQEALVRAADALAKPDLRVEALAAQVAAAVVEGWQADEVVVLAADRAGVFKVLGGAGERWRTSLRQFGFRRDERHGLAVALHPGEAMQIVDLADNDKVRGWPDWIHRDLQIHAAMLVPWGAAHPASLVLFAGWRSKRPGSRLEDETRALRALLALVDAARRLRSD